MPGNADFITRLEKKVRTQLSSQRVAYLLGAGSSFLGGAGYPLAGELWEKIKDSVPEAQRTEIQALLDSGAEGLEQVLDLLDDGGANETPHRHLVTDAIADYFSKLSPPLDIHSQFLERISARSEPLIPIFSLNYDPLIERGAETAKVRVVDGFIGIENAYFDGNVFQQHTGLMRRGYRGRYFQPITGVIHLLKLHGSLGWFELQDNTITRVAYSCPKPINARRLMIPPQRRKATETMTRPYATMWSEFREILSHGPRLINRLTCVGYGMRDEHVNAVIENGLARRDFTLLVFSKELTDEVFTRWSIYSNVIIITENRCSLYSEVGDGHPELWDFGHLHREV